MHKVGKETTYEEIGENVITTSSYIYISIMNTRFAITKWSQDQRYMKLKEALKTTKR